LSEALERERATGAILRVIASSPTTVDPVFDAILDSALRLCASPVGNLNWAPANTPSSSTSSPTVQGWADAGADRASQGQRNTRTAWCPRPILHEAGRLWERLCSSWGASPASNAGHTTDCGERNPDSAHRLMPIRYLATNSGEHPL
jgi:hypothetical protein